MLAAFFAKAGARIVAAALALLGVVLTPVAVIQYIQINGGPFVGLGLRDEVAELQGSINNPETGYIVELDRARQGTKVCEAALARQNQSVKDWKATADQNAELAKKLMADAKLLSNELRRQADAILSSPTVGDACKAAFNRNRDNAR